ncbi:HNH endonuclease [Nocardiopsis lucentensis]|uniref:HNH endonuclease n=1 Tax=Nocardiopsis lucentensis TaxID=53441 RepID=UPI0012681018|nr:HNH endonuclease [Nocardiopsis lucentensis]
MDARNTVVLPIFDTTGSVNSSTIVDSDIYPAVSKWMWEIDREGYVRRFIQVASRRHEIRLHRLVMACSPGDGLIVDHINRNTLDNRRANLRFVNPTESNLNREARRPKPRWRKSRNCWQADFQFKFKYYYVGCYRTFEEAQEELDKARQKVMGPLAGTPTTPKEHT